MHLLQNFKFGCWHSERNWCKQCQNSGKSSNAVLLAVVACDKHEASSASGQDCTEEFLYKLKEKLTSLGNEKNPVKAKGFEGKCAFCRVWTDLPMIFINPHPSIYPSIHSSILPLIHLSINPWIFLQWMFSFWLSLVPSGTIMMIQPWFTRIWKKSF